MTRLTTGTWIVVVLIPAIVVWCLRVRRADSPTPPRSGGRHGGAGRADGGLAERQVERQDVPAELRHLAVVIEALHRQRLEIPLTVVVPEVVPRHRW